MENEIIVGLDIGTTKIACFIGQRSENKKIKILGWGKTESVGVSRGVVINIEQTAQSIRRAVEMAEEQANVQVCEVYVGIAGQHIKSMQNRGNIMVNRQDDIVTEADVQRLLQDQYKLMLQPGEEIIHVLPQDYIIDGEVLKTTPVGVAGACLEGNFHIITGHAINIRNIYRSVRAAELEVVGLLEKTSHDKGVSGLILEPIASAEAVLDDRDKDAGVVLVDIGGGTTDIAIFHDGVIRHTAVISMGGNVITDDIKEGCSIMRTQAEALKRKYGSCLATANKEDDIIAIPGFRNRAPREISMKTLAGIIEARMTMILEQVFREIQISGYERKLIAGIVITGGGAMIKHAVQLTEFITGIDTRIGTPNEHLSGDAQQELSNPMYATGIGLVIHGIEETEMEQRRLGKIKEPSKEKEPEKNTNEVDTNGVTEDKTTKSTKGKIFGNKTDNFFQEWIGKIFNDDVKE